jgi:hypothetical protein
MGRWESIIGKYYGVPEYEDDFLRIIKIVATGYNAIRFS